MFKLVPRPLRPTLLMSLAALSLTAPALAKPVVTEVAAFDAAPGQVLWLGRQALVTGGAADEVLVWDQHQLHSLAPTSQCQPTGAVATRSRHFLLACAESPRLLVMNDAGQIVETFPRPPEERGLVRNASQEAFDLTGVTAMVSDSRGGVYIAVTGAAGPDESARGKGRIYYLSPARTSLTALGSKLDYPAGLALASDGKSLYVSEGLSRQVSRYEVQPGALANPRVIARIPELYQPSATAAENPWPGAMAFNSQGHLYIALPGDGKILVASADGKRLATLDLPVPYLRGFSFGRTDRTVYVTGSDSKDPAAPGRLYEVRL